VASTCTVVVCVHVPCVQRVCRLLLALPSNNISVICMFIVHPFALGRNAPGRDLHQWRCCCCQGHRGGPACSASVLASGAARNHPATLMVTTTVVGASSRMGQYGDVMTHVNPSGWWRDFAKVVPAVGPL